MNTILGARKMIVLVLLLAVGTAVALVKGDVPPGLLQLLSVLFGGFVLGNSVEHGARAYAGPVVETSGSPESPVLDTPNLTNNVDSPVVAAPSADQIAQAQQQAEFYQKSLQGISNKQAVHGEALALIQQGISHIITKANLG